MSADDVKIITQQGEPVVETSEEGEYYEGPEALVEAAKELGEQFDKATRGVKKFRDGFLFKVGLIAVTIKVVDVIGKIVMENQRLKAKQTQDDEQ